MLSCIICIVSFVPSFGSKFWVVTNSYRTLWITC